MQLLYVCCLVILHMPLILPATMDEKCIIKCLYHPKKEYHDIFDIVVDRLTLNLEVVLV